VEGASFQPASSPSWETASPMWGFQAPSVIARKKGAQVKLYSRPGNDLTYRFPLIVETLAACARAPGSSTARRLPLMTTASLRSIVSATTTMPKHFPVRLRPDRTKGHDHRRRTKAHHYLVHTGRTAVHKSDHLHRDERRIRVAARQVITGLGPVVAAAGRGVCTTSTFNGCGCQL
jgi:hypothetical protein